jgi:peptidoglycan-associated lipoprotein
MLKFSNNFKLAAVSAALLLAACTPTPKPVADMPPVEAPAAAAPAPAPVTSSIVAGSEEDLKTNVGDTVHFDYDKHDLRDDDKALLQKQAAWLAKFPAVRATVEGHCDERGTREYNLALGARRANAVKEYLVSLGVSASRLDTISYGKEKPICTDSNETCYSQNRRGVTVVAGGASS